MTGYTASSLGVSTQFFILPEMLFLFILLGTCSTGHTWRDEVIMLEEDIYPDQDIISDTIEYSPSSEVIPRLAYTIKRIIVITGCFNYIIDFA